MKINHGMLHNAISKKCLFFLNWPAVSLRLQPEQITSNIYICITISTFTSVHPYNDVHYPV